MCGHNWQAGTENKPQSYQYKNLEGGGLDVAYEGTHNSMMNIGRTDDRVERKESCGELLDTCLSLRLLFGSPCSYGFRPYKPQSEQTADSHRDDCQSKVMGEVKRTELCPDLHLSLTPHSTPSTLLLPALTLSAGGCKVSGGERKVSRRMGLPRNPHSPHSKPRVASPIFGGP
jgi:hypothetical protein